MTTNRLSSYFAGVAATEVRDRPVPAGGFSAAVARVLAVREVVRHMHARRLELAGLLFGGLWLSLDGVVAPEARERAVEMTPRHVRLVVIHDAAWELFRLAHGDDPGGASLLPGTVVTDQAAAVAAELAPRVPGATGAEATITSEAILADLNAAVAMWVDFWTGKFIPTDGDRRQ